MADQWRFLTYSNHDAASNMAIDEAILEAHLIGQAPPTLRLYGFEPSAISIGYAQKLPEQVITKIREQGMAIVRRPTGGRAVLHRNDLTYSFVGTSGSAAQNILSESISQAYRQICMGLIESFRELGLELEIGPSVKSPRDLHDCFAATTNADLHLNGVKMIGSAQLRRKHVVLQHGSIVLEQDQALMSNLLSQSSKNADKRHANLFDALGRKVKMSELEEAIRLGFSKAFNRDFVISSLSKEEQQMVNKLRPKYEEFSKAEVS